MRSWVRTQKYVTFGALGVVSCCYLFLGACGGCDVAENQTGTDGRTADAGSDGPGYSPSTSGLPEGELPDGIPLPGTLGECASAADCVEAYRDTPWPYQDPDALSCEGDVDAGKGYCSECSSTSDCPEGFECRDARFCMNPATLESHCRSDEECKRLTSEGRYPRFSPFWPVRCLPLYYPAGGERSMEMECVQCRSDDDCTPDGTCFRRACKKVCTTDADCTKFGSQYRCPDSRICL